MKKNTPPMLPVPSQSRTCSNRISIDPAMASQGTKRKWDHESSDLSIETPLTTDMIMENARQILQRVSTLDEIDKGNREKVTIGIFGKSGEGKTSLLNAILGKQYLFPSGCLGACTAVVTQVEANLTDSNYTAEIKLFSKEEWKNELKNLFKHLKDDSDERDEAMFEIAVEKITALYGPDADQKTLEELQNDKKIDEIGEILSKKISNSDPSEFSNNIASFIQHSESCSGDWYWPLVKSVTITIPDCNELLENIVLLDLPGTGDCNKTRDDLWKSKLRECSSVWIVSAINRAVSDKGPWGILEHCVEELGPGGKCKSINFICTKTDDINPVEYIRSARLPRDQIPEDKVWKILLLLSPTAKWPLCFHPAVLDLAVRFPCKFVLLVLLMSVRAHITATAI
ncbi:nuclear GTPase SLIP-GC-like [Garra rufa]|uniref:nuclear GTPase SLIP-GC-like n=1 Tax=Garra rufa TaxID=137080 RepID=UPI003CCEB9B0